MFRLILIIIFTATLLLKGVAILQNPPLLGQSDGVMPLTTRTVLVLAMLVEAACILGLYHSLHATQAARIALGFIIPASIYRLAGSFSGASHCPCLGSLTGWWPWLAQNQTAVLNTLAAWMFLVAVLVLARNPARKESADGVMVA